MEKNLIKNIRLFGIEDDIKEEDIIDALKSLFCSVVKIKLIKKKDNIHIGFAIVSIVVNEKILKERFVKIGQYCVNIEW
jgi:hypothetical protein